MKFITLRFYLIISLYFIGAIGVIFQLYSSSVYQEIALSQYQKRDLSQFQNRDLSQYQNRDLSQFQEQANTSQGSIDLSAQMNDARFYLFIISFMVIFILVFLVGLYLKRAIKPLESLANSSQKITSGVYETIEQNCVFPEIQTPINSFNVMVENLQKEVAEREAIQQTLLEEKQFSLVTLASIIDAVVSLRIDHTINYMNPKAEELLGQFFEECENQPFRDIFILYEDPGCHDRVSLDKVMMNDDLNYHQAIVFFHDKYNNRLELEMSISRMSDMESPNIGYVIVLNDVTADRELKRQLSYEALHDSLTGLINRYEFERRAMDLLESSYGDKNEHVLMFMDLDQFKVVNDTCGHLAGDELLKQLASTVHEQIRSNDSWARLGGDEFGLLMGNCDIDHALKQAEKVSNIISSFRFSWDNKVFKIGISIGVVEFGLDGTSLSEALSHADSACYMSKNSGNENIHVYKQDDQELQEQQGAMNWVSKIHAALEDNRFVLYFQLIKPLDDKDRMHGEILIRYLDETDQIIGPGAFLPAAERYKLSGHIDRWVIEQTFNWIENNLGILDDTVLGINLSGLSLSDEAFLKFIIEKIETSSSISKHICFEITETAVISNIQRAINFISSLKAIGCHFALDDFGSGLSSFAYLKNFPVDFLKIDGIFIKNIDNSPDDVVLVKAMVSVAHGLGMKTIAEFVENIESVKILKELGVDYVQGYGIEKPKPLSDLIN